MQVLFFLMFTTGTGGSNTCLFPSFREGVLNANVAMREENSKRTKGEHKVIVLY